MSISPPRKRAKGFALKPTEINHFTGKPIKRNQEAIDIEIDREAIKKDDPEIYVQVGEVKQVYKYGERPEEKPSLIRQVISEFKLDEEEQRVQRVTTAIRRNRSHSEDAFFKKKNHA